MGIEELAFRHLRAVKRGSEYLTSSIRLRKWTQSELERLIDRRLMSEGLVADYSEVLGAVRKGENPASRNAEGRRAYLSVLADVSGGNPTAALAALRSAVELRDTPGDGSLPRKRAVVKPFQPPDLNLFETLPEDSLFLLAAVVRHRELTAGEAARATGLPRSSTAVDLSRLGDLGLLTLRHDRFTTAPGWLSTMRRQLRRKNILASQRPALGIH